MEKTSIKSEKVESKKMTSAQNVANHKKIASHLQAASKSHLEAAKHHEDGNVEKAAFSTITAHGHVANAVKASKKDVKNHAYNGKN